MIFGPLLVDFLEILHKFVKDKSFYQSNSAVTFGELEFSHVPPVSVDAFFSLQHNAILIHIERKLLFSSCLFRQLGSSYDIIRRDFGECLHTE